MDQLAAVHEDFAKHAANLVRPFRPQTFHGGKSDGALQGPIYDEHVIARVTEMIELVKALSLLFPKEVLHSAMAGGRGRGWGPVDGVKCCLAGGDPSAEF
jgi:hypothetical protein